jgi:predicted nicotinamide N-methyase
VAHDIQVQQVLIDGSGTLTICSLRDKQQFDDPQGHARRLGISSAAWPLFGCIWPSGLALAARLARRPRVLGERLLEIGCGLGLASLIGHRLGMDMTASDCHPLAARFLARNLRLNRLAPMKYRHGHWTAAATAPDSANPPAQAAHAGHRVQGPFDLIIGSDILYERDPDGHLALFIARHAGPQAEVWIVDPDRANRPAFHRHMAAAGFRVEEERLDQPAAAGLAGYKGRLLIYHRSDAVGRAGPGPA